MKYLDEILQQNDEKFDLDKAVKEINQLKNYFQVDGLKKIIGQF